MIFLLRIHIKPIIKCTLLNTISANLTFDCSWQGRKWPQRHYVAATVAWQIFVRDRFFFSYFFFLSRPYLTLPVTSLLWKISAAKLNHNILMPHHGQIIILKLEIKILGWFMCIHNMIVQKSMDFCLSTSIGSRNQGWVRPREETRRRPILGFRSYEDIFISGKKIVWAIDCLMY